MYKQLEEIRENLTGIKERINNQRALVYATYLLGVTENMFEQISNSLSFEEYEELEIEIDTLYGLLVDIINSKMIL